jgi:hypothetical protein
LGCRPKRATVAIGLDEIGAPRDLLREKPDQHPFRSHG